MKVGSQSYTQVSLHQKNAANMCEERGLDVDMGRGLHTSMVGWS